VPSRRTLLRGALIAGIGSLLAACTAPASPGSVPLDQPTSPPRQPLATPPVVTSASGSSGGTVVFGASSEVRTLNPLLANDGASQSAYELLFDSLVKPDPSSGAPVAALADRWDQSADGLTYTLHIRPGVTWSDGQPLTADDARFTLDTVRDPNIPTVYRSRLDAVESIKAVDASTLRIALKQPFCPFLSNALQIPIVPKHLLAGSRDLNTDQFNTHPVGSGPFTFKEWQNNDHLTLAANPSYWAGRPKIDQWVRKVVKDDTVIVQQLKTSEVDYASVQPEALDDLRAQSFLSVMSFAGPVTGVIAYNLDRPLFQDVRVRQALTLALDRAGIIKSVLFGEGDALNSPIVPASWAHNTALPAFAYDPARARQQLLDAGWTPGSDGVLEKDGARFEFTLLTNTGNKVREAVSTIAQDQWSKVGVRVHTQFSEFGAFTTRYQQAHDFDAVLTGGVAPTDPDLTTAWSSKEFPSGGNYVHYANPDVDALIDKARTVRGCDQSTRKSMYDRAQALIADDQPMSFLYVFHTSLAANKRIRNISPSPWSGASPYVGWNITNWSVG